jgi:hypothetical protein
MRLMMRLAVVVASSCLAACNDHAPLGTDPVVQARPAAHADASADEAAPPSGRGPVKADAQKPILAEAGAAADAPPPLATSPRADASALDVTPAATEASGPEVAGELITCAALAAGGKPDLLTDFQWQYEVPTTGPYNLPYDTVKIDNGCALTYQKTIMPPAPKATTRTVTMGAGDCADARGWATNARFLEVLRTGDGCPYGEGNPGDVFELTLTNEGRVARKTYLCPEPTLEAVRACLRPLVARLFPK